MDIKNTVILLILLLSILGLIIGVHYTSDDSSDVSQNSEKISLESDSPTGPRNSSSIEHEHPSAYGENS